MAAPPPFKVKAVYEYVSEHDDDLNFLVGQVITVTELEGDDWYVGEYTDSNTGDKKDGLFPANFVEKYEPEVPARPNRSSRLKEEPQTTPVRSSAPTGMTEAEDKAEEAEAEPPVSSTPAVDPQSSTAVQQDTAPNLTMPSESIQVAREDRPPAPNPAPAKPAETAPPVAKKAPPPVAAKSNAFKDRIAAFNQPSASPIAPIQPGRKVEPGFVKKPFIAPPPSKNAYVPPVTQQERAPKPYRREEDPEIKEREAEDRKAAEAAGLSGAQTAPPGGDGEVEVKPMTLKQRMALLQKQQEEQAQRRAEGASSKREKTAPAKQSSESSERALMGEVGDGSSMVKEPEEMESSPQHDTSARPPVPSSQPRSAAPIPHTRSAVENESGGNDGDQSGTVDGNENDMGITDSDRRESEEQLRGANVKTEGATGSQDRETSDAEDEDEEEVDEETRRKEELRARMARLGGGGLPGMGGPFNPFGAPPPPPAKKKTSKDRTTSGDLASTSQEQPQQRMIAVPGMQRAQSRGSDKTQRASGREPVLEDDAESTGAHQPPEPSAPPPVPKGEFLLLDEFRQGAAIAASETTGHHACVEHADSETAESRPVPSQPPQDRAVAPQPDAPSRSETRHVPPPTPGATLSPGPGSESDDEMSMHARNSSAEASGAETPLPVRSGPPPLPGSRDPPPRPPVSSESNRQSQYSSASPSATPEKRFTRTVPPIPGPASSSTPRPPPPPRPECPPPRQESEHVDAARDDNHGRVESDYDGDYDTDIASSAKHKDALKAPHVREASLTDHVVAADHPPAGVPPPLPQAPRAVPPPPPPGSSRPRASTDRPSPPVGVSETPNVDDDDYDPYRYDGTRKSTPVAAPAAAPPIPPRHDPNAGDESSADDVYPSHSSPASMPQERAPPPPPHQNRPVPPPPTSARPSADASRTSFRRSMEQTRMSGDHIGQMASDLPLDPSTPWWTGAQPLPPAVQGRVGVDILTEFEESSKSKRGGKKELLRDIYILYMDYSQTVISAKYDAQDPSDVHLEQRHEPAPPRLRQDQLEAAWQRFGCKIAETAALHGHSKKEASVGDGTPSALPLELLQAHTDALRPVGTRAYGALVYANLANASTMQFDEIRRGDVVTARNAKFEGHHGAMKSRYKADYGPSHVGVVEEWDGTKRSVKMWEQGRERKGGVRAEKLRLGDLRSGEIRVWRVVGRDWVGWESS